MLGTLFRVGQQTALLDACGLAKSTHTTNVLDAVNARFGRSMLCPAQTGVFKAWAGRQSRHAPCHMTCAEKILVAEAF